MSVLGQAGGSGQGVPDWANDQHQACIADLAELLCNIAADSKILTYITRGTTYFDSMLYEALREGMHGQVRLSQAANGLPATLLLDWTPLRSPEELKNSVAQLSQMPIGAEARIVMLCDTALLNTLLDEMPDLSPLDRMCDVISLGIKKRCLIDAISTGHGVPDVQLLIIKVIS